MCAQHNWTFFGLEDFFWIRIYRKICPVHVFVMNIFNQEKSFLFMCLFGTYLLK